MEQALSSSKAKKTHDVKHLYFLVIAVLLCAFLCGCEASSKNQISEDKIVSDLEQGDYCGYAYVDANETYEQGTMKIVGIAVEKRMTTDEKDTIYAVIDMEDEIFHRTAHWQIEYLNYTQGGWILESVKPYEDSAFSCITEPQETVTNAFLVRKFNSFERNSIAGDGTEFSCTYSILDTFQYCDYYGEAVLNMTLKNGVSPEGNVEWVSWVCELDTSAVYIDWSKVCGYYSHETEDDCVKVSWDDATLDIEADGNNLLLSGVIRDETMRDSQYGHYLKGAYWPYSAITPLQQPYNNGTSLQVSAFLGEGSPWCINASEDNNETYRFLQNNDYTEAVQITIHPYSIALSYTLKYHNGFWYDGGKTCTLS